MAARPPLDTTLTEDFGRVPLRETVTEARLTLRDPFPTDELPVQGDIIGGHYRLVRLLGTGMFGRVYLAERTDVPEHKVALKVITRAVYAGRDVERELVMLAAASHPHVVQLKDHGMAEHYVWLTMPVYEGETLAARLERGPLGLREAYEVFLPIARGIAALHVAGLRHQDIKPENIYLARFAGRMHPVILDLGVAVECSSSFVAGTVLYASPEQVSALGRPREGMPLGAKMDTYCLAATLLRSLVGPRCFPGEDAETPVEIALAYQQREQEPLAPSALPDLIGEPRDLLVETLSRWLCSEAAPRPTMGELADELDVLLAQEREAEAAIERGIARQKASLQRFRLAAGAMVLVGLGAAGVGYAKRETLRLASELAEARAVGAASFDKLDTCAAAHELSQHELGRCASARSAAELEFEQTLQDMTTAGSEAQGRLARRLTDAKAELRGCERDAKRAEEGWETEKEELSATWTSREQGWQEQRAGLVSERDGLQADVGACESRADHVSTSRDECRQDLASCVADRDTCMSQPPAPVACAGSAGAANGAGPADPSTSATETGGDPQPPAPPGGGGTTAKSAGAPNQ